MAASVSVRRLFFWLAIDFPSTNINVCFATGHGLQRLVEASQKNASCIQRIVLMLRFASEKPPALSGFMPLELMGKKEERPRHAYFLLEAQSTALGKAVCWIRFLDGVYPTSPGRRSQRPNGAVKRRASG